VQKYNVICIQALSEGMKRCSFCSIYAKKRDIFTPHLSQMPSINKKTEVRLPIIRKNVVFLHAKTHYNMYDQIREDPLFIMRYAASDSYNLPDIQ